MRGERIGQSQFGGDHRAEMARAENPQRHVGACGRHRLNPLAGTGRCQECLHFENVLRKIISRLRRAAQGAQRELIGAGGPSEAEIDAARKQPRQRAELFGDHIGRVVGQHDAAGADADRCGALGNMGQHDGGRRTGDARHVVVLGHPDPPVSPALGMHSDIARMIERATRVGLFGDPDEIEDGEGCHGAPGG